MSANLAIHEPYTFNQRVNERRTGIAVNFTENQLQKMAAAMLIKHLPHGSHLFWEGDPSETVYWILSGRLKLRKCTHEGKNLLLTILQTNDMIAELDTEQTTHRCSAEVMDDVVVGAIPRRVMESMLQSDPDFAYRFAMWTCQMVRKHESKLRDLVMGSKVAALASTLLRLSNSFGIQDRDGMLIGIKLTNNELAELAGTTREGVNRMLASMKKEGTIGITNSGLLKIYDISDLRAIAGCPGCNSCSKEMCSI